tara:strand:+ start:519 stop:1079 length:561 start_codon:yes stop_codon:yes gene_type:complete
MISTDDNYENKLDNLLKNVNKDYNINQNKDKKKINDPTKKNMISKQYDSLNYSLEMHKVRKNKKADFDIYSNNNLNIEDDDIDKCIIINSWKELSEEEKYICIKKYSINLFNLYNNTISEEDIISFINNNLSKIKYDKVNKCIIDIQGLSYRFKDNKGELYINKKINTTSKDSRINKLRKSLKKRK